MPILKHGQPVRIDCTLNGRAVSGYAEPRLLLSDFLRHQLGATGTHVGCEHGICGACTVALDGEPVRACLTLAVSAQNCHLTTVEGFAGTGDLTPLQQSFRKHHALQCGFCTPGIMMSLHCLFLRAGPITDAEIEDWLAGHLCRCTGYYGIVQAAKEERDRRQQAAENKPDG